MSPQRDATTPSDARAQRRWLIGLAITVMFGLFGAVMAVLAYNNATSSSPADQPADKATDKAAPAPGESTPPAAPAPYQPGNGKGRKK